MTEICCEKKKSPTVFIVRVADWTDDVFISSEILSLAFRLTLRKT